MRGSIPGPALLEGRDLIDYQRDELKLQAKHRVLQDVRPELEEPGTPGLIVDDTEAAPAGEE